MQTNSTTIKTLMSKKKRRRGQGMTEYIIIVGLIAILMVAAVTQFKDALNSAFTKAGDQVKTKITDKMK